LLGEFGSGKTSLVRRYMTGEFEETQIPLHNVNFSLQKEIPQLEDKEVNLKLHISDTSGQEQHRSITVGYFRYADGVMLVYDVNDSVSFRNLGQWVHNIETYCKSNVCVTLVGSKTDLVEMIPRATPRSEAESFATGRGYKFTEASSKTGKGVEEAFLMLVRQIVERDEKIAEQEARTTSPRAKDWRKSAFLLSFEPKSQTPRRSGWCSI